MSLRVVINGKFMGDRMQGIVRYARELMFELDQLLTSDDDVTIALPKNSVDVPKFINITTRCVGHHTGIAWEQIDFANYLRQHPTSTCLNLCNVAPIFAKSGVTAIHDVMYRANPQDYKTLRNQISRFWHIVQYALLAKREKQIITVSEFSKGEIERYYPAARGKVQVVPCAWQHIERMPEDDGWMRRYPELRDGQYFFTCATRAKNKNGRWVIEIAKRNPQLQFAVAGGSYEPEDFDVPPNVCVLGFVSDGNLKSLIRHCRAFLFPSLYEGFGIPPLEALALGAKVIAASTSSLPEVLGESAIYIDPFDYEINLALLVEGKRDSSATLRRYSWRKSAQMLRDVLEGPRGHQSNEQTSDRYEPYY